MLKKNHKTKNKTGFHKKYRNILRYTFLIIAPIFIVTAVVIFAYTSRPDSAEAGWYDETWGYRKPLIITNTGAADGDKKVKFDIDTATLITANKIQSDCGDSRFTDATGNILRYYIDTSGGACNTSSTDYYVLLPTINANSDTVVYHYYGNENADNGTEGAQFSQSTFTPAGSSSGSEEQSPGPIGYWKMDEGSGSTTVGMYGNNGSITGAVWKPDELCKEDNCLLFDGTDDNVSVTADPLIDLKSKTGYSVCGWVNPINAGEGSAGEWFSKGSSYVRVDTLSSNTVEVSALFDLATADATYNSTKTIPVSAWSHVCVTYTDDGDDEITVYINGNTVGSSVDGNGSPTDDSASNLIIGGDSTNNFNGFIDEVKVYNYERTAQQIKTDYLKTPSRSGSSATFGVNPQSSSSINDGLIGYWNMDESAWTINCSTDSVLDGSGNKEHGDVCPNSTGPAAGGLGRFGYGAVLDGSNDDIRLTTYSIGTVSTISFWAKINSAKTTCSIMSAISSGTSVQNGVYFSDDGLGGACNRITFKGNNAASASGVMADIPSGLNYNWTLVTGVSSPAGMFLYINGELIGSNTTAFTNTTVSNTTYYLGSAAGYSGRYFYGTLDDVRIYNRALSQKEIRELYNWAPSPVSYYPLNENTGTTTVADVMIAGNNLSMGGSMTQSDWVAGIYGSALDFDGSNDNLTISDDPDFDFTTTASFTLEAWVKHSTQSSGQDIILAKYETSGADGGYKLLMESDGDITCGVDTDNSGFPLDSVTTTAASYDDDRWHHVACVKDSSNAMYLYVDGVLLVSDASLTSTGTYVNNDALYIGIDGDGTSNAWLGQLDEIRVYNYARTSKQVVEDMNASHPAPGSPAGSPVLQYRFDEGVNDTCSGGSNDVCNSGSQGSTLDGTSTAARTQSGYLYKALDFDGLTSVVTTTNSAAIDLNDGLSSGFTFSTWINADSDGEGDNGQIFYKGTNTYLKVSGQSGNNLNINASLDLATTDATLSISAPITTGTWNHLALIWEDDFDDEITVYVNGVDRGSSTDGSGAPAADTSNLLIGGITTANFDGKVDEFKVFPTALTAQQIYQEYSLGKSATLGALSTDTSSNPSRSALRENCAPGNSATECEGLLAEYRFDENSGTSTAYDTAGVGGYNLAFTGITSGKWIPGQKGSAIYFDGAGDCGALSDDDTFDFDHSESFTIEAWFKHPQQSSGQDVIISKYNSESGEGGYWLLMESDGDITCAVDTDNSGPPFLDSATSTAATYDNDVWHHSTCVYNSGDSLKLYIDGVLVASDSALNNGDFSNGADFVVGSDDGCKTNDWLGAVDNVKLYTTALSQAEIAWNYNKGKPVSWIRFDECQGVDIYDVSAVSKTPGILSIGGSGTNSDEGTCDGGSAGDAWYDGREGKINGSLEFDDTDDYVYFSDDGRFDLSTGLSMSAWIKTAATEANNVIVSKGSQSIDQSYEFGVDGSGNLYWGTSSPVDDGSGKVTSGVWHHVAVTNNDSTVTYYVDGVKTGTDSYGIDADNNYNLYIGHDGLSYFDGQIDDVQIFNYVLTDEQVRNIHNQNSAVKFN